MSEMCWFMQILINEAQQYSMLVTKQVTWSVTSHLATGRILICSKELTVHRHCPIHWHFASCFIPKAATDTRLTTRVPIFSWISCIIERPLEVHIFTVALSIGKELNILDLTSKTKWHNSFSITHTSRGPRKAMSDGSLFHNFRKCFNAMLYTKPNYNIMLSNPTFLNLE